MKDCPSCNRTYADETLTFCLADGSLLSAPYDPDATLRIPRSPDDIPTEVIASTPTSGSIGSNAGPLLNQKETQYYADSDVTVTSRQIVSKNVTLMMGDIASVEYRSDGSKRKGAAVLLLISAVLLYYVIDESASTLIFRAVLACVSLLLGSVSIYGLIVGFGAIYVNSQGQPIKVVEGTGPDMRKVKQAIGEALLNKKAEILRTSQRV